MNVFVYGTLRRGEPNHRLVRDATFLGEAVSKYPQYGIFGNGVPFLVEADEGAFVKGELYDVTPEQLSHLDALEGHPEWYYRKEREFVPVMCLETVKAWVYLQQMPRHEVQFLDPTGEPPTVEANRYGR